MLQASGARTSQNKDPLLFDDEMLNQIEKLRELLNFVNNDDFVFISLLEDLPQKKIGIQEEVVGDSGIQEIIAENLRGI